MLCPFCTVRGISTAYAQHSAVISEFLPDFGPPTTVRSSLALYYAAPGLDLLMTGLYFCAGLMHDLCNWLSLYGFHVSQPAGRGFGTTLIEKRGMDCPITLHTLAVAL